MLRSSGGIFFWPKFNFLHVSLYLDVDDCDPGNIDIAIEGVGVVTEFGFCGRNGKCIDGIDMYNCSCHKGWTGKKCEIGKLHISYSNILDLKCS